MKKASPKKAGPKKAGPKKAGPKKASPKKACPSETCPSQTTKVQSIRPEKKSTTALKTQLSKKKPLENYKKIAAGAAGLVGVGLGAAGLRDWMRKLRKREADALLQIARARNAGADGFIQMENIADDAALPRPQAALPRPQARIFPEPRTRSQVSQALSRARSFPEFWAGSRVALPRTRSLPRSWVGPRARSQVASDPSGSLYTPSSGNNVAAPAAVPRRGSRIRYQTQFLAPLQSGMEVKRS